MLKQMKKSETEKQILLLEYSWNLPNSSEKVTWIADDPEMKVVSLGYVWTICDKDNVIT